jgi:hypothetical protein
MSNWITPKENWSDAGEPTGTDFNRIESNTNVIHEMILSEATERVNADINASQATDSKLGLGQLANLEVRTDDPSVAAVGHMWLRIDL